MIFDSIEAASFYLGAHPLLPKAFTYLDKLTVDTMPTSRMELEGEALAVVPFRDVQGLKREQAELEVHKKYADLHYLLDGQEEIGWRRVEDCSQIQAPFDIEKDFALYRDRPETWISLKPRQFVLVWPDEAHAPKVSDGRLSKVVIKLLV